MSKVRLKTLTPVHIGSGNVLHNNIDFIYKQIDHYRYVGVVDHRKLMNIIGPQRVDSWVAAIERGKSIAEFIKKCSTKELTIEDYSSRLVFSPSPINMKNNEPMREYIHDGFGKAYIPGSSLKGAIRTALTSYLIKNSNLNINTDLNLGAKFPAKSIESMLFGGDPNCDSLRFLQVGDVYFDEECEYVYDMININERERQSFIDESKHQLVEAVFPEDASREFHIKLTMTPALSAMIAKHNQRITEWNDNPINEGKKNLIKELNISDMDSLFSIINEHTKQLLKEEIDIWYVYSKEDGVSDYIAAIRNVLRQAMACKPGECVLRVGHASGWRFTTGAWAEDPLVLDDGKWHSLVDRARPGNQWEYQGMQFPKSRRIHYSQDEGVTLMGFVKLSVVE